MQGGTVIARNLQPGIVTMSSDPHGTHVVEWAAAGDPSGGDIQLVPEELAKTVPFVRAVQKHIIALDNDETPEFLAALAKQVSAFENRQKNTDKDIKATIERTDNKDLVVLPCIGPSVRGTGTCGADVTVRELSQDAAPALCNQHINLAPEFVPTPTGEFDTNVGPEDRPKEKVRWVRSRMSATPIGLEV